MFKTIKLLIEKIDPSRKHVIVEVNEPFPPLTFGWWDFDETNEARIQKITGYKVRFVELLKEDPELNISNSENQHWMKFEFSDGSTSYPLLIEWRYIRVGDERPIVWKLDYLRSLKLWQKNTPGIGRLMTLEFWHKMDLTVIDALACWPQRKSTGIRHEKIAVQGGYLNNTWTENYYRVVEKFNQREESRAIFKVNKSTPDNVIRTTRWRFQNARKKISDENWDEIAKKIERPDDANLEDLILQIAEVRPHFVTVDRSRFAIPLTMNIYDYLEQSEKGWNNGVSTYWLFSTPQYITSWLGIKIPHKSVNSRNITWQRFPTYSKLIGTKMKDGSLYEEKTENFYGQDYFVVRDFEQFLREATHLWQPTELLFTGIVNNWPPERVTLYPPVLYKSSNYFLGGTTKYYSISQYTDLSEWVFALEPEIKREHVATKFFEDTDGLDKKDILFRDEYNLNFDMKNRIFHNRKTGQNLKFDGYTKKSDVLDQNTIDILKFTYHDADMEYPLIIRRQQSIRNKYFTRGLKFSPPYWIIDHNASSELWCSQQKSDEYEYPEYGRWKRVHDFVVDAILLWPEIKETGASPNGVCISVGGWFKEDWLPEIVRSKRRSEAKFNKPLQGEIELSDLNAPPCVSWKSVTQNNRKDDPDEFNLDVSKLTGDPTVPNILKKILRKQNYHLRKDNNAILFVCRYLVQYHRGQLDEKYYVPVFQYCDEDIWVQFNDVDTHWTEKSYSTTTILNPKVLKTSNYYHEDETKVSTDLIYRDQHNSENAGPILQEKIIAALEGILCDAHSHTIRYRGRPVAGKWQMFSFETIARNCQDKG